MSQDKLTPLQRDFLDAFFKQEQRFFLTGGAALAGFYLSHRETHDLDLFTSVDALEDGVSAMRRIALDFNATVESLQTAPDFRRFLFRRETDAVVVDLVRDRVPQIVEGKNVIHGIRVDVPEEILANKLCALLSRCEIRDLVDVRALEITGYPLETALIGAATKDGGLTPAQLAWVLRQIVIDDNLEPPGGVLSAQLRDYLADLIERLATLAYPAQ